MSEPIDVRDHNRTAWAQLAAEGNRWTVPVSADEVARARENGGADIVLTPIKPIPPGWLGDLRGARVLALASAGGQQGPLFAAAGAEVTVFDNSPVQLEKDAAVARREGIEIRCVEGDMRDLSAFADGAFDLVYHPVANCYIPDIKPVWTEVHRVLRPGGALIASFFNPIWFQIDDEDLERIELVVRHAQPYSDLAALTAEQLAEYQRDRTPVVFGHSLEDQLGGQIAAGLAIVGFYEDVRDPTHPFDRAVPRYFATRAIKAEPNRY